ncbi:hypothetical protein [Pseudoxanthomonas sp. JBR18]|uniref:hypothetical protein n=1 Tax=Pseudoxanthomonas sp. JBR18 TaxID=2969308 RepID=UPI002306B3D7|nr:hypothetical protein [Pseudoxanthomonas sp. JBR18]WCE05691.1 hypothetical protein PJ250_07030 [Pseudoxanthomonas sp. JBR18]
MSRSYREQAEAFAALHDGGDATQLADNLHARIHVLRGGGLPVPAMVAAVGRGNAWVCSPRTTYADYAAEEARRLLPPWQARPLSMLCAGVGRLLDAARIDRAVSLNNWGLSTNLYPALDQLDLAGLIDEARTGWPDHALWFRSLNPVHDADWLTALRARGFLLVASRQVYLREAGLPACGRDLVADLRLLQRQDLRHVAETAFVETDYPRIAALYAQLYLDKYSRHNPAYHATMLRDWHRRGLLQLRGFRDDDGQLLCIAGMFGTGTTMTTPIVGYDTSRPQRLGLYRTLTACGFDEALRSGRHLNLSAGAAGFKRLRGATPAIEYSAVWLPPAARASRAVVSLLSSLTCRLGVPLMRKYQL